MTDQKKNDNKKVDMLESVLDDISVDSEILEDNTDVENETQCSVCAGLEKKLGEQEEITKRAQSDYFRLKMEFDAYVSRQEEAKKTFELDGLVKTAGKLLPFVTQLSQSIEVLPESVEGTPRADGISLIQSKMMTDLAGLGITPIVSEVGMTPDLTMHIPVGLEDTDDDALKGNILKVIQHGYMYEKGDVKRVIQPASVVVGG